MKDAEMITLEVHAEWQKEMEGFLLQHTSIGPNGEIFLLLASAVPVLIDGSFPPSKTDEPIDYKVVMLIEGKKEVILIPQQKWNYHFMQPLGNDKILLVSSRARRYENGEAEENARIFDREGNFIRSFCMGDGIGELSASADGKIWTGYFDEGVFGNYGWDNEPIGSPGLICWSDTGEILHAYEQPSKSPIMDCNVINMPSHEEVWFTCGIWDQQIVIRRNGKNEFFKFEIPAPDVLATTGEFILLNSGFNRDAGSFLTISQ